MASKLGYTKKQFGGKIGYDQSLITAITRHFNEAVKYDESLGMEVPQKSRKQPIMGDYYTYNGERDNVDYNWEKNENKDMILYANSGGKKVYINESSLNLLINEGFQRSSFYVKCMLRTPVDLTSVETTEHWDERSGRISSFAKKVKNTGDAQYSFIVSTNHPNGDEIHTITERAFIIIQNKDNKKVITILAARPRQITRYWNSMRRPIPNNLSFNLIMRFAKANQDRELNNM
jgi:hypothetical protein